MLILEQKFAVAVTVAVGVATSLALITVCRRKYPDHLSSLVPVTLVVGQLGIHLSKWPAMSWGPSITGERRVAFANDFGWLFLFVMTIVLMAGTWRFRRQLTLHAAVIGSGLMFFVVSQVASSIHVDLALDVEMVVPMLLVAGGLSLFSLTYDDALRSVLWTLCTMCTIGLLALLVGMEWAELGSTRRIPAPFIDGRFQGLLTHPNFLAQFAAIGCVVAVANVTKVRLVAFFVFGLTLWFTDTRTQVFVTFVALLLLCLVAVLRRAPSISPKSLAVICSCALVGLSSLVVVALQRRSNSSDFGTLNGRTGLWPHAIRYWETSPFIGVGPKAFDLEFRVTNNLEWAYGAHNQFLQTLASEGLVGMLSLACVLVGCGLAVRAATGRHKLTLGLLCLLIFAAFLTETPLRLVWFVPAQLFATVMVALFSAHPSRHSHATRFLTMGRGLAGDGAESEKGKPGYCVDIDPKGAGAPS
jgi:O-antigen ligase